MEHERTGANLAGIEPTQVVSVVATVPLAEGAIQLKGMGLLLTQVAQRLAGKGGEPVVQLQTAFGGGKTHTMLAVYHLATRMCARSV